MIDVRLTEIKTWRLGHITAHCAERTIAANYQITGHRFCSIRFFTVSICIWNQSIHDKTSPYHISNTYWWNVSCKLRSFADTNFWLKFKWMFEYRSASVKITNEQLINRNYCDLAQTICIDVQLECVCRKYWKRTTCLAVFFEIYAEKAWLITRKVHDMLTVQKNFIKVFTTDRIDALKVK